MLERLRRGIANAKAEGKYRGRKPTARAMAVQIMEIQQGLHKSVLESKCGDRCENRVKSSSSDLYISLLPINPAFKFHTCNDRH
jgi:DNA invertase Pin-like site-specific DNA recombinase